jgi:hypothetical protein
MTISADGPARTDLAGAVHEAVLYADPGELADGLATRLGGPIAGGQRVVAVVDGTTRAALRRALGPDADRVEFPDPAQVHRLPAFTVAQRWVRLGRGVTTPGGRATVVGQHVTGLPEADAAHRISARPRPSCGSPAPSCPICGPPPRGWPSGPGWTALGPPTRCSP